MKFLLSFLAASLLAVTAWAAIPVNVNTASAEQISENLKGIGPSKAQLIVEYRETNGSFMHVDELVKVKGIGIKTIDQNRGMILLSDDGKGVCAGGLVPPKNSFGVGSKLITTVIRPLSSATWTTRSSSCW